MILVVLAISDSIHRQTILTQEPHSNRTIISRRQNKACNILYNNNKFKLNVGLG